MKSDSPIYLQQNDPPTKKKADSTSEETPLNVVPFHAKDYKQGSSFCGSRVDLNAKKQTPTDTVY